MVEFDEIIPVVDQLLHQLEDALVAIADQDVEQFQIALFFDEAKDAAHGIGSHVTAGQRHDLVQQ